MSAEAKIVGSRVKDAKHANTNFYFSDISAMNKNYSSEQQSLKAINEETSISSLVQNHLFNSIIKNKMIWPTDVSKNDFSFKLSEHLSVNKIIEMADDQCAFDPINRRFYTAESTIKENKSYNLVQKIFNIELENRIAKKLKNSNLINSASNITENTNLKADINSQNLNIKKEEKPYNKPRILNGATIINGVNLANLKFVKPAPQCFYWENHQHRIEKLNCRLWHPRELCKFVFFHVFNFYKKLYK